MGDVRLDDEIQQAAIVRPGDTLLIRVDPDAVTPEQARRLTGRAEAALPDVKVFLIGAADMAVYRPEGLTVRPDDVVSIRPDSPEPLIVHGADIAVVKPEASE